MSIKSRGIKKVGIATVVTFTCLSTLSSMSLTKVQAAEQQAEQSQTAGSETTNKNSNTADSNTKNGSNVQNSGESYLEQRLAGFEKRDEDFKNAYEKAKKEEAKSAIYNDDTQIDNSSTTIGQKARDLNENNALGVASGFHIFAKDKATLNVHTEGNVATKDLYDEPDFGSRGEDFKSKDLDNTHEDIHYVRHIEKLNAQSFYNNDEYKSHVVLQGDFKVEGQDRPKIMEGDRVLVDNHNTLKPEQITILHDSDKSYIDFDQEFKSLSTKSDFWSKQESSKGVEITGDSERPVVNVENAQPDKNNFIYVKLPVDKVGNDHIDVVGLGKTYDGDLPTVVISVDNPKETKSFTMNSKVWLQYNAGDNNGNSGKWITAGSESHDVKNQIIWNFGTNLDSLNFNGVVLGSVLAPNAKITAPHNVEGNIIGREVVINGESHRWDLASHTHRRIPHIPNWGFIITPPKGNPDDKPSKPDTGKPSKPDTDKPSKPHTEQPTDPTPSHEEEVPPTPENPTPNTPNTPNTPPNVPEGFVPDHNATYTYSFAQSHGVDTPNDQEQSKDSYTRTVRDKADTFRTVTTTGAKTTDFNDTVVSGKNATNKVVNTANVVAADSNNELPKTGANAGWMASLIGFATFALGAIGLKLNKKNR